ncbi:helix-turn-helix domain-containing protein [Gorillibacterium sp. CAU 1737]|uniref:helix-turn-helix domain-containing protein n=1 Tax=Gorillibacterium sp. CAU 1737 TaxID=3140362 RepID=UPI0032613B64
MEKKWYLQKAISLIEQNLSTPLTVERMALECYVSPRQFYRDFYSLTGHSVHEYIRKRRLSKALHLLRYSDMDAAAVAYACGYSSQAAFCQSVKAFLGVTTREYKEGSRHYYFPALNMDRFVQVEVKSGTLPSMLSIHYRDRQLIGIEHRAVSSFLTRFPEYKGRLIGRNEKQVGKLYSYQLQVEYSETFIERIRSSGFLLSLINPPVTQLYAKILVKNDEALINDTWDFLYSQWMKNSMFEQDDAPYFEEYIRKNGTIQKLALHLPIKLRSEGPTIRITTRKEQWVLASTQRGAHAEKGTAKVLAEFLSRQYPYLLKTQTEYYLSKEGDCCTSGVFLNESRYIPDDGSLSMIVIPGGTYAVLEGNCYGKSSDDELILRRWLDENGFEPDRPSFLLYDVSAGTEREHIRVRTYIKMAENEKTSVQRKGKLAMERLNKID